jgi:hypothetical protein
MAEWGHVMAFARNEQLTELWSRKLLREDRSQYRNHTKFFSQTTIHIYKEGTPMGLLLGGEFNEGIFLKFLQP